MEGRNCGKVTVGHLTPPRCGLVALLFLAALAVATAVAQRTPQPVFTELFTYDPAVPSQLLGKWLISSQLDTKLQPLRVGVVEDSSGVPVGRVTVQEGDGLEGASEAMLQARHYICDSEGSRAAEVEAEPGGIVPSERAEIQLRSDRATGAGELVKFDELVWYRFSFKIAGDWPQDVPAAGRQPCRTVIHQIKQDSFKRGKSCNASPFFKIEARPLGDHVRFFAQVAAGTPCAEPPMVKRAQICRRDLRGRAGPRCRCASIPRMTPVAASTSGSTARSAARIRDPWPIATMAPAATARLSSTHRASASIATGARRPRRSISTRSCSGTRTQRDTRTGT
jgi:hypothetical protein